MSLPDEIALNNHCISYCRPVDVAHLDSINAFDNVGMKDFLLSQKRSMCMLMCNCILNWLHDCRQICVVNRVISK